jgi:hypothetical protein
MILVFSVPALSDLSRAPTEARERFGFGLAGGDIREYDVSQLRAGLYLDWVTRQDPAEPAGLEYAQMIRLHQLTDCWPERLRDRESCPYVEPYTYTLTWPISRSAIVSAAQANPGSLWLIGNEMDRYDWGVRHPLKPGEYLVEPGGQDEMLPEVYAQAYHEFYHLIKSVDPTAEIAIGGVIQPTPLRLEYLDGVLAAYQSLYGTMIPVDVWNIHNMILNEVSCMVYPLSCQGAEVPPGSDAPSGRQYSEQDADDIEIFKQHVRDFRQWMKDNGERDKPLIISEYSVLFGAGQGYHVDRVKDYLLATFDYMTSATDSALGYPSDGNRLVQRWVWYSLNDDSFEGSESYHHLFDPDTKQITELGVAYGTYPDASAMVSLPVGVGWNQIALPVGPLMAYDAEELCRKIEQQGGDPAEVDRWYAGGWEGHICGKPFNNFTIDLGAGYFVKSSGVSTWTVGGFQITDPVPIDLQTGWNSVSIPHTNTYTAESLCNAVIAQGVAAVEIDRWYAGGWEGHICGKPFNDFAVETGSGYFIKADSAGQVILAGE